MRASAVKLLRLGPLSTWLLLPHLPKRVLHNFTVFVSQRRLREKGQTRGKGREGIGMRLTMTSRTGYFQERSISPSMVRQGFPITWSDNWWCLDAGNGRLVCWASTKSILHHWPTTDYHILPILAPICLLTQLTPLLMQCGEKDLFVDNTVIFTSRIREAKCVRKVELDLVIC